MTPSGQEEEDRGDVKYAARAAAHTLTQWPLLTVLGVVMIGAVVAATGHWRWASFVIGCGVGLAAFWRLVLPGRLAGLLVVRSRWFDVALTALMAIGILFVTLIVPPMAP